MDPRTFPIGELASRTGVAVKTIRYYADEGLLPPRTLSDGGYRLFADEDEHRLAMIRSLRELGFSLETIRQMLERARDPASMVHMQLDVVDAHMRALERQRSILRAASTLQSPDDVVRHLHAAHAAATLGAAERTERLDAWLGRAQEHAPVSRDERSAFRAMIVRRLPETLSTDALEAWIRLSALLDDDGLIETLRLQWAPFEDRAISEKARAAFALGWREILDDAVDALAEGRGPRDDAVGALVARWRALYADTLGRADDGELAAWLIAYATRVNDPRIEAFWRDVAMLHGTAPPAPFTAATALLIEALRFEVSPSGN